MEEPQVNKEIYDFLHGIDKPPMLHGKPVLVPKIQAPIEQPTQKSSPKKTRKFNPPEEQKPKHYVNIKPGEQQ